MNEWQFVFFVHDRNDFIEIQAFLKYIPLKSKQEKEDFFRYAQFVTLTYFFHEFF